MFLFIFTGLAVLMMTPIAIGLLKSLITLLFYGGI